MNIYVDNAATTKISLKSKNAMIESMEKYYGNPSSLHTSGQTASEKINEARRKIAKIFNANEKEIYFTSGGSEADNQAIKSIAEYGKIKGKKHIITSAFEHHAVLHTLKKLEKQGFEITRLPVYENGIIKLEDLVNAIREDTVLVTIMYANNEIGTIMPVREIGSVCREKNIFFHTDAVQAAGHIDIDVEEQKIDMMSVSAHKFNGPKGAGILYARKGTPIFNIIEGGAQERGRRAGTENLPAIIGMAVALEESIMKKNEVNEKITKIREYIIENLLKTEHSKLNGDRNIRLPGIVNFCFEGIEGEALLLLLNARGIEASSGSACTSGSLEPSHVLLSLGLPHEVAHGSLRISLGEENTMEEALYIVKNVREVVEYLRNISPLWEDLTTGKKKFVLGGLKDVI